MFHYVYVIQNDITKELYIGKTKDLHKRVKQHNAGEQKSTKRTKGEWVVVYAEAYKSQIDATNRENKLKSHGSGKRWLKERIKNSLID